MIARQKEQKTLLEALKTERPRLVAITGRRRIGKTYLIRETLKGKVDFEMVGLRTGTKKEQIRNFTYSMREAFPEYETQDPPDNWLTAFYTLSQWLDKKKGPQERKVVFIDELPWVASPRSGFLTGFEFFWNSFASKKNMLVIICGSAASWMIKKVINNTGGLYNRVTDTINLAPLTLRETEAYLKAGGIKLDRHQILQLYMTMGGVPHYLNQVKKGLSATQNIEQICFHRNGTLRTEFENLYQALFAHPERHEAVIEALGKTRQGMTRAEIVKKAKIVDGGGMTSTLRELEQSGFIASYYPFNKKKKDTIYRLTDYYSLFYLKYIRDYKGSGEGHWKSLSQTQSWKSWAGYTFENVCLQHVDNIKEALGISGMYVTAETYRAKGNEEMGGVQIDLLLDRSDKIISLCEMKYYNEPYQLNKKEATKLNEQKARFRHHTKTRKQLFQVLITPHGLHQNQYSLGHIDNTIILDDLF